MEGFRTGIKPEAMKGMYKNHLLFIYQTLKNTHNPRGLAVLPVYGVCCASISVGFH